MRTMSGRQITEGELHVLAEFERWADTGVNTHVGLKRRVVASAVSKGLLVEVAPRDPDEAIRFEITVEGRRALAAWQRKTRQTPIPRPGRL
jgi:hypothetical protein